MSGEGPYDHLHISKELSDRLRDRSAPVPTPAELRCIGHLIEAWNAFTGLDSSNADNVTDFRQAIHTAQRIIAVRVAHRVSPDIWTRP